MSLLQSSAAPCNRSAAILSFPLKRRLAVRVEPEAGDLGWYVLSHDRKHGWLHGDFDSALQDARTVARSCGVVVVSSAGITP